jgi:hypothetical protein
VAGEWIPIDIGLGLKPEIQELVDLTGQTVETVVYRLIQMWGWVSINTADGTIRATPARVARICGGDADFWLAVETVGWLKFNSEAGIMTVSGWEARFSKAAKARSADRIRKSIERQQDSGVCPEPVQDLSAEPRKEIGVEERRGEFPPPPPRARDRETGTRAEEIVLAWGIAAKASGGKLAPFQAKKPPAAIWDRFDDGSWADQALAAIERLPRCRYFDSPPTLEQLCGVKGGVTFVERVLAGAYDGPKNAKAGADGRPTTQAAVDRFKKSDPARDAMVREYREAKQARKAATA